MEAPSCEIIVTEKFFPSGDIYIGQWMVSYPHGQGKYLWADGCIYVGDWCKGIISGKGKFSWPCGATYEGIFDNGNMDGEGVYLGSQNDTYRGTWVMNLRHGKGTATYDNGDQYDGEWRYGLHDGQGKYMWSNGSQYIGTWKNGKMKGSGTLIWSNGNRYDGCWEDGFPKGNGTFRWIDGSFYVGMWNKDATDQIGTYYPLTSQLGTFDWDPQEIYIVDLVECGVFNFEKFTLEPPEKMVFEWSLQPNGSCDCDKNKNINSKNKSGSGTSSSSHRPRHHLKSGIRKVTKKPRRLSLEEAKFENGHVHNWGSDSAVLNAFSSVELEEGFMDASSDVLKANVNQYGQTKRQGEAILKGHKNYELMLNLQLGIRHSVGRPGPSPPLDLDSTEFDTTEKIWTKFPPEGSKFTPPHQSAEFRWKDYCPLVFRTLRKLFNVDPADYMLSICGNDALRELSSPGKSGSFFYLTNDDKYMIKTMKKSEVKVLKRMLPAYYNHVRAFDDCLVTKFYGLHCVKLGSAQKKVRFVIMGNLFRTEYAIHRRYDLKGSSLGRTTYKSEDEIDDTTTLKDLDLRFIFRLREDWFQDFCRQVDKDCEFLEQERIMDYSLLIGLHFQEKSRENTNNQTSSILPTGEVRPDSEGAVLAENAENTDATAGEPPRVAIVKLGTNMPARVERTMRSSETQLVGDSTGEFVQVILYFGIIDILQDYDISKKLEHAYKSIQYDPTSISAVDPKQYSRRFRDFVFKIFTEDT